MYTKVTQHYADQCAARQRVICLSLLSTNSTAQLVPFLKHLTVISNAISWSGNARNTSCDTVLIFDEEISWPTKGMSVYPEQFTWGYIRFTMYIRPKLQTALSQCLPGTDSPWLSVPCFSKPARYTFCGWSVLWRLWSYDVFIRSLAALHKSDKIRYFLENCESEQARRYKSRKPEPEL